MFNADTQIVKTKRSLMKLVLQKVISHEDTRQHTVGGGKYISPPPELDANVLCRRISNKRKKHIHKYGDVQAKVDSSAPRLNASSWYRNLQVWGHDMEVLQRQNMRLLTLIRNTHFLKGKVDSHWSIIPCSSKQYYRNRVDFLKRTHKDNLVLYKRISNAVVDMPIVPITVDLGLHNVIQSLQYMLAERRRRCRVTSTTSLEQEWVRNKRNMVDRALNKFVLFPPIPREEMEDTAFAAPAGVRRPRVYITIGIQDCAVLGELCIELFTDVCPQTCQLFTELLMGDKLGHGYVGTTFFRKVPYLYWSGGDVNHNNGFGCYAQRGRVKPIGAENYHFPHSIPGLVSMRVTCDNEVCGIFNITFKALPQFDLRNVVFGRIIRPSITYDTTRVLGKALSSYPVVDIRSSRSEYKGHWIYGETNTRLIRPLHSRRLHYEQRKK